MEILYLVLFFLFGLVLGSFFNVLGLRLPNHQSIVKPKSHCPRCDHKLKWWELIPVLSYCMLKGKCYNCKEKISLLYPIIELSTGVLYAISYYSFGISGELVICIALNSLLMLVIVSDLTYMIIPDSFIIGTGLIIIITKIVTIGFMNALISICYGVIAFAIMYLIMLLGNWIFKKETLGGADIKLMFIAGLTLNPIMAVLVIFLASFVALPISLVLYFKNKENVIPFGPFIVLSILIIYLSKIDFLTIIKFLLNQ